MSEVEHDTNRTRALRVAVSFVASVLPLAAWPGLAEPFSTPKRWLLGGAVCLLLPLAAWKGGRLPPLLQAVVVAWLVSFAWSALAAPIVSPDALLLGIAGPLWCLLIALAGIPSTRVTAAHVAGASAVACIALAQAAGMDPFAWCGWQPGIDGASLRMRVYGTLGNPNFVAAMMAITFPLACGLAAAPALSRSIRARAAVAMVLLAAALVVTGSRAGAIGLGCGVVTFAVFLRHRWSRWMMAGAVLAAVVAIEASGGRGTVETLRGRVYIWKTTWARAWERPIAGVGPGAFELHYASWEKEARATRHTEARERRFAGPQQFAHNDYLHALVERGVAGLAATGFFLATPVLVWRSSRRVAAGARAGLAGAAGAVAACAAVACFDFPLERPAESAAVWMAAALAWQASRDTQGT